MEVVSLQPYLYVIGIKIYNETVRANSINRWSIDLLKLIEQSMCVCMNEYTYIYI